MSLLLMSNSAIMSMALGRRASRGVLGVGAEVLAAWAGIKHGVTLDAMFPRGNGSRVQMSGTDFAVTEGGSGGHGTLILLTESVESIGW
jgi:hypothetical protein